MNFLIIADRYPQPDHAAGDLRFFTLLSLLARKHKVVFCALNPSDCKILQSNAYRMQLERAGISVGTGDLNHVLNHFTPDIVWFEFYHQMRANYLALLERHCPRARTVVDSVDVHFNRLATKARLTRKLEDEAAAAKMKTVELAAYALSDMVIVVSKEDRQLVRHELPDLSVEVVPLIHSIPEFSEISMRHYGELIFIGGFNHEPNIDAMLYFCSEVMPLIRNEYPQVHLKIIGSNPPKSILALSCTYVEVLGYVPDTKPFLTNAYISIAPLRYGGGTKGKVSEAMSYGLPVVTTSIGAEGFGLQPGQDLLIGDTAESFAAQVRALLADSDLYERIARRGYQFIEQHYSVPVVEQRLDSAMQRLANLPPRVIPLHRRLMRSLQSSYVRHVAWRLNKS